MRVTVIPPRPSRLVRSLNCGPVQRVLVTGLACGAILSATTGEAAALEALLSLCLAGVKWVTPDTFWQSWSLAPEALLPLLLALLVYFRLQKRSAIGGTSHSAFLAGWLVLVIAFVSPLCRLSATLVSAHMVQHMLLITAAPMLLAYALPWRTAGWVSTRGGLHTLTGGYGLLIWLWHAPLVYAVMLSNPFVHLAGYAALVIISTMFWAAVFGSRGRHEGAAFGAVFTTMVHTGLLGALLTFSPRLLYPILAPGAPHWGLQPLQDQQLAGLIMWVPGGLIYLVAGLAICAVWLRGQEGPKSRLEHIERRSA